MECLGHVSSITCPDSSAKNPKVKDRSSSNVMSCGVGMSTPERKRHQALAPGSAVILSVL